MWVGAGRKCFRRTDGVDDGEHREQGSAGSSAANALEACRLAVRSKYFKKFKIKTSPSDDGHLNMIIR